MHHLLAQYSNFVGIIGVILTLLAYLLLNMNRVSSSNKLYLYLNLSGSCMLLYSLLFHWNLASVLIEIAWISISFLGIFRMSRRA